MRVVQRWDKADDEGLLSAKDCANCKLMSSINDAKEIRGCKGKGEIEFKQS